MTIDNSSPGDNRPDVEMDGHVYRESIATDETPSVAVAMALANVLDICVEDLAPLNNVIEPGALDRILGNRPNLRVTFMHAGHWIIIDGIESDELSLMIAPNELS